MSCSVVGCNFTEANPRVTFYPFPREYTQCAEWARLCGGGARWWPADGARVCSRHFARRKDLPLLYVPGSKSSTLLMASKHKEWEMVRLASYMMLNKYNFQTFQNPRKDSGVRLFYPELVRAAPHWFKEKWRERLAGFMIYEDPIKFAKENAPLHMIYMEKILKCAGSLVKTLSLSMASQNRQWEMVRLASYMMLNEYDFETFQYPRTDSGVKEFDPELVRAAPNWFKERWRERLARYVMYDDCIQLANENAPPHMIYMEKILKCAYKIVKYDFLGQYSHVLDQLPPHATRRGRRRLLRLWERVCVSLRMKLRWWCACEDSPPRAFPAPASAPAPALTRALLRAAAPALTQHAHLKDMMIYSIGDGSLRRLLWLARKYRLETHPHRLRAWVTAYRRYTQGGWWCPFVLFQRRWLQLKEETRIALTPRDGGAPTHAPTHPPTPARNPHPLHWILALRWPHVLTGPQPAWAQLLQEGRVYDLQDAELDQVESVESADEEEDDRDDFVQLATKERLDEIRKMPKVQFGSDVNSASTQTIPEDLMHLSPSIDKPKPTKPNMNSHTTRPSESVITDFSRSALNLSPKTQDTKSCALIDDEAVLKDLETIDPAKAKATIIYESDDEMPLCIDEDKGYDRIKVERNSDDDIEMEVRYPLGRLKNGFVESDEDTKPLNLISNIKEHKNPPHDVENIDGYHIKETDDFKGNFLHNLVSVKKEKDSDSIVRKPKMGLRIRFEDDSDVSDVGESDVSDAGESDTFESTDACAVDGKLLMDASVVLERIDQHLSKPVSSGSERNTSGSLLVPSGRIEAVVLEKPDPETDKYACEGATGCRPVTLPRGGWGRIRPVAEVKPLISVPPLIPPNSTTSVPRPPHLLDNRVSSSHAALLKAPALNESTYMPSEAAGVCSGEQLADMIEAELRRVASGARAHSCCPARASSVHTEPLPPVPLLPPRAARRLRKIKIRSCCSWLIRRPPPSAALQELYDNRLRDALFVLTNDGYAKQKNTEEEENTVKTENVAASSSDDDCELVIDNTSKKKYSKKRGRFVNCTKIKRNPSPKRKKRKPSIETADVLDGDTSPASAGINKDYQEWMRQRNEFKKYFTIKSTSSVKKTAQEPPKVGRTTNINNDTDKTATMEKTYETRELGSTQKDPNKDVPAMKTFDQTQETEATRNDTNKGIPIEEIDLTQEEEELEEPPNNQVRMVNTSTSPLTYDLRAKKPRLAEKPVQNTESVQNKEVKLMKSEIQKEKIPSLTILSNPLPLIAEMMQTGSIKLILLQNKENTKIIISKNDDNQDSGSGSQTMTANPMEESMATSAAIQNINDIHSELIDEDKDELVIYISEDSDNEVKYAEKVDLVPIQINENNVTVNDKKAKSPSFETKKEIKIKNEVIVTDNCNDSNNIDSKLLNVNKAVAVVVKSDKDNNETEGNNDVSAVIETNNDKNRVDIKIKDSETFGSANFKTDREYCDELTDREKVEKTFVDIKYDDSHVSDEIFSVKKSVPAMIQTFEDNNLDNKVIEKPKMLNTDISNFKVNVLSRDPCSDEFVVVSTAKIPFNSSALCDSSAVENYKRKKRSHQIMKKEGKPACRRIIPRELTARTGSERVSLLAPFTSAHSAHTENVDASRADIIVPEPAHFAVQGSAVMPPVLQKFNLRRQEEVEQPPTNAL